MRSLQEVWGDAETVPLDFTKDDATWAASKISSAEGALGADVMELRNWLLRFGCASEKLRVVVARLADWMANHPPLPPPGPHKYVLLLKYHM